MAALTPVNIATYLESRSAELVSFRRTLHQYPELSFKEFETTNRIADFLEKEGFLVRRFDNLTGLVVDFVGKTGTKKNPKILIRGDIDALPIPDLKECAYKSKVDGVMHACGHDVHTTSVIGMLLALKEMQYDIPFSVRVIFQPGEETGKGALALIDQGILAEVDYAISLHVDTLVALGKVAIKAGPINAAVRDIEIKFTGRPAHVARMYQGVDAIATACAFVNAVYAQVPRRIDARDPHLVFFGTINGGTAANIVAEEVTLKACIRAFSSDVSDRVLEEVRRIGEATAFASGAAFHLEELISLRAVVNNEIVANAFYQAAYNILGEDNIVTGLPTSMGGEDFGAIMEQVPGAMMRLGVAAPDQHAPAVHTHYFDAPEECILIAAKVLAETVLQLGEIV